MSSRPQRGSDEKFAEDVVGRFTAPQFPEITLDNKTTLGLTAFETFIISIFSFDWNIVLKRNTYPHLEVQMVREPVESSDALMLSIKGSRPSLDLSSISLATDGVLKKNRIDMSTNIYFLLTI